MDNQHHLKLCFLLVIIAHCVYTFYDIKGKTPEQFIFHATLFSIFTAFFFISIFKHIHESIFETVILIMLTGITILKIIHDWQWISDYDVSFCYTSAIIPIFFTCFELAFHHFTNWIQFLMTLSTLNFVARVSVMTFGVQNQEYVRSAVNILVIIITLLSIFILR